MLLSWLEETLLARSCTATPKSIHIIFFWREPANQAEHPPRTFHKTRPPLTSFPMGHTREAHFETGHLVPWVQTWSVGFRVSGCKPGPYWSAWDSPTSTPARLGWASWQHVARGEHMCFSAKDWEGKGPAVPSSKSCSLMLQQIWKYQRIDKVGLLGEWGGRRAGREVGWYSITCNIKLPRGQRHASIRGPSLGFKGHRDSRKVLFDSTKSYFKSPHQMEIPVLLL